MPRITRTHGNGQNMHIFFSDSEDTDVELGIPSGPPDLNNNNADQQNRQLATSSEDTEAYDVDAYIDEHGLPKLKRTRSKVPKQSSWKKDMQKESRLKDISYVIRGGQRMEKRAMGLPCITSYCQFISNGCQRISEQERAEVFTYFWKELSAWTTRKTLVHSCVAKVSEGPERTRNLWRLKLIDGRALSFEGSYLLLLSVFPGEP